MNYYIPIHIDNIDNVISAESISPADDYVTRGYGYSRFKTLKELSSGKEVILFNHILSVEKSTDGNEQICYIEVEERYVKKDSGIVLFDGGMAVAGSVDLYPWNCRFLFLTEEALYQAVVICRSSLCNKMWEYYQFSLLEGNPQLYSNPIRIESNRRFRTIKEEVQRNRLKGFLFSFTIGRFVSIPQWYANLLQIEKRMYDVATTIAGLQSYEKDAYLKQLYELEEQFEKYDPVRLEIQKQWLSMIESRFTSKEDQLAFESIVKDLGAEDLMKSNFAKKNGYYVRPRTQMAYARVSDWDYYKKSLEEYTLSQIYSYRKRNGNTNTNEDFKIDGLTVVMNPKYGNYYSRLIANIIEGIEWFNLESLRLHRLDFASELTRMARDMMIESGQEWEGSPVRTFMNDLRQHIASGRQFDISQAPDITLKSLAIFVLKGDDYEEMLRYMENTAQVDYRFVLGLWGVCVGYADMPKTIIQRMKLDGQSISQIYLSSIRYLAEVPEGCSLELHTYQFKSKVKPNTESDALDKVLTDKSIGLTKVQKEAIRELWEMSNGHANRIFYEQLACVKGIGKVKIKKIRDILTPNDSSFEEEQLELFGKSPSGTSRIIDMNAWQYIEPLLPDDRIIRSKVKDDLRWYLSRRRTTETNHSVIKNYKEHLQQKAFPKNPRYSWTAEYFGGLDIDGIIKKLEKIYL